MEQAFKKSNKIERELPSSSYRKRNDVPKEWLEKLKEGDYLAFNQVFNAFYMPVLNFLKLLTHSAEDAEEICQDVFAKIWINRTKIDSAQNFRAYLFKISRNETYDFFKRRKLVDADSYRAWQEQAADSPEEFVVARETELLIQLTVSRMPRQRKLIFELSRFDGLSNEEIANQLNIKKNAVEKQLTYAMKDIRHVLAAFIIFFIAD